MKKSKIVSLVLITAALASCHKKHHVHKDWNQPNVYMRSDESADYSQAYGGNGMSPWLWYYAFRPYGYYDGYSYHTAGYYSGGISSRSNLGSNSIKSGITRSGFGTGSGSHRISVSS